MSPLYGLPRSLASAHPAPRLDRMNPFRRARRKSMRGVVVSILVVLAAALVWLLDPTGGPPGEPAPSAAGTPQDQLAPLPAARHLDPRRHHQLWHPAQARRGHRSRHCCQQADDRGHRRRARHRRTGLSGAGVLVHRRRRGPLPSGWHRDPTRLGGARATARPARAGQSRGGHPAASTGEKWLTGRQERPALRRVPVRRPHGPPLQAGPGRGLHPAGPGGRPRRHPTRRCRSGVSPRH